MAVRAVDRAGNVMLSPSVVRWDLDTVAPVVEFSNSGSVNSTLVISSRTLGTTIMTSEVLLSLQYQWMDLSSGSGREWSLWATSPVLDRVAGDLQNGLQADVPGSHTVYWGPVDRGAEEC